MLRPATVCGYAPRLRLDLAVNILTNHAVNNGRITVFGGEQQRPNIHIEDMTDLYVQLLERARRGDRRQDLQRRLRELKRAARSPRWSRDEVGNERRDRRHADRRPALVPRVLGEDPPRSSGFEPKHTIEDAVRGLVDAFTAGKVPNSMTDIAVLQHQAHAGAQSEIELV